MITVMADVKAKQTKPFWGRVSLIESPVEETVLRSGVVVPMKYDGDSGVKRGVIVGLAAALHDNDGEREAEIEQIQPGTVVFYRDGVKLPDGTVVVDLPDILAFES